MTWVRLEDQYPINRKVAVLSDAAFRLDVEAICWSNRHTADGRIGADELKSIRYKATKGHAAELVTRGRWHTAADYRCTSEHCPTPGPDGWVIHDYWKHQPTREKVEKERAGKVARQHRWLAKQRGQDHDDIDPLIVYQRDGWICWICGGPTKRGARSGDPKSPSIDHVKPTSKGGSHTYDNVRCAHLRCNKTRGARDVSDDRSGDASNGASRLDASRDASKDATPLPHPPRPAPKEGGGGAPAVTAARREAAERAGGGRAEDRPTRPPPNGKPPPELREQLRQLAAKSRSPARTDAMARLREATPDVPIFIEPEPAAVPPEGGRPQPEGEA